MPGSGRSWHVGGGTCQDREEVGMLKGEHARIAAKLACWRRTCQLRTHNPRGQKNLKKNVKRSIDVYLLVSRNSLLVEGYFSGNTQPQRFYRQQRAVCAHRWRRFQYAER